MSCAGRDPNRILYVADAFRAGWTLQQVFDATKIDPWFLSQIEDLLREEAVLAKDGFESLNLARLRALKRKGFSDSRIAKLVGRDETDIRRERRKSRACIRSTSASIPAPPNSPPRRRICIPPMKKNAKRHPRIGARS